MLKHLRLLFFFVLLSLLFTSLPAGQSDLVTLFGPETFVRNKGKLVTEVREFSTIGFMGPYILHVQNGNKNGNNRVSSAEVWLNDERLLGPSNFSQQVSGYDIEVELDEQNLLEVKIASKPESFLKIWIEGIPVGISIEVELDEVNSMSSLITSEDGGVIEAIGLDGIKYTLIIPEFALLYDREITLTPVISMIGLPLSSGMVGAVKIDPDGLQLMKPVTLIIDFPFMVPFYLSGFSFDNYGEGFHLLPIERGDTQVIFEITHFSLQGTGAVTQAEINALKQQGQNLKGMDLFQNKVAIIGLEMKYYYGLDWRDNPNLVDEYNELVENAYVDWFEDPNGMQYILQNAEANLVAGLDDALAALGHLRRLMDLLFGFSEALPRPINCGDGWICLNWESLELCLEEKIKELLEEALKSLNKDCTGGISDEEKSGEILAQASRLDEIGVLDLDMDYLKSLKICGIATLEVIPASKVMGFNEQFPIEIIAKDKDGNLLSNRPYHFQVWDEEIIGFDENALTIFSFEKEGKTWLEVYDEITKGIWSADVKVEVTSESAPIIEIQSHPNNCFVTSYVIELIGNVYYSGEVPVDSIEITIGPRKVDAYLQPNGEFKIQLELDECANHLVFSLFGTDSGGNKIPIGPHNFDIENIDYQITLIDIRTSAWTCHYDYPGGDVFTYVFIGNERSGYVYDIEDEELVADYIISGGEYSLDGFSIRLFETPDGTLDNYIEAIIEGPNLMTGDNFESGPEFPPTPFLATRDRCGMPPQPSPFYFLQYLPLF